MKNKLFNEFFVPVFLIVSMITTISFLFINNIKFINEERFVINKIEKYLIKLNHYDNCVKFNTEEKCIIQHQKMIDSRDDMDNAIIDFYNNIH